MSVVPVDEPPGVRAAKRESFWDRLARALDQHLADRSRREVPAATLRRSKHDIDRCRRLMRKNGFKNDLALADAGFGTMSHRSAGVSR
jgi:hypothetical protein